MLFIHHSNTKAIIQFFDSLLTPREDGTRGMAALYGCEGTGKSHLLSYWSSVYWGQEHHIPELRLVRIDINDYRIGSLKGKGVVYSTAESCVTFSAIAEQLGTLSARYDSESVWAKCAWYKQPRPLYTDKYFLSLAAFVRSELHRLRVVGIIIDNAHLVDIYTVQQLVKVRALLHGQLALVFCAPIDKPQTINEHVDGLIARSRAADEFEPSIELQHLDEATFTGPVLNDLLEHMRAIFAADLPPMTKALMRKVFWLAISRDWRVLAKKVRDLNRVLASQRGPIREITLEIFERIVGKLPSVSSSE
jgi:hypothetical protein